MPDATTSWLDIRSMRRRFARAAADRARYDDASWLHREVAKRMAERLDYIKLEPGLVVDAGAGSGHAWPLLAGHFPAARIVAIDMVARQLDRIAPSPMQWLQRWVGKTNAHPVVADFLRLPFGGAAVQCIWSNLALQWAPDPPAVFAEWHRVLATEGLLLFSTLGPDTLKELRGAWQTADERVGVARGQPAPALAGKRPGPAGAGSHVHPFIDMHDIGDMLVHAGFSDPVMDMETITLQYRDVDALVADLRGAGVASSHADRMRGITGRDRWRAMREAYEALRSDGKLPATFEVVYGHAWKPKPRATADRDGIARVRVEDIGRRQ